MKYARLLLLASTVLALTLTLWAAPAQALGQKSEKPQGIAEPVLLSKVQPKYPEDAKKEKIQGEVRLEAIIDTEGKTADIKAVDSPDERLSKAAIDAVRQWTFNPARNEKGQAVKAKTTLTVKFRLM